MAELESLFSLEVIVESVENIVVSSRIPAIAFRLLDFPTLVIRSEENGGSMSPSSYKFNTGKSCLFKINKDKLYTRLQSTPLYVMLVDICAQKTKLLASTTISLYKCFENVWRSIERNGIDVPVVLGNKGVFELYNLMGTPVAMVRLNYRIFSLGGTINGHVNICKTLVKTSPCQAGNSEKDFSRPNQRSTFDESSIIQNSSQNTENHLSIFEVETQTDFSDKKECMKSRPPAKSTIGKENVNITRPPPLYYNSQSSFMNSKSLGLTNEKRLVEKRNYTVDIEEAMPKECYRTVSVQTTNEDLLVHRERAQLSDLPLINALLNELSLAKQNCMNTATQLEQCDDGNKAKAVNSQELHVPISQPDTKPPRCGVKKKLYPSPKGKINKNATVKLPHKGVLICRNPLKNRKSLLMCGTTKTQKLREAFNKKSAGFSNSTGGAEGKSSNQLQITSYGVDKSKQEITQLQKEKKTSGNNTQLRHNKQTLVFKDVGIQVIGPDDNLFPTQQNELSDDDHRNLFETNTPNDPPEVCDSNDIQDGPNKTGSQVELSIHSMSSAAEELVSVKQLPVAFSNFPPPTRKNSRYSNDKQPNEEEKSSSIDIGLSEKNGLLGKTSGHSKGSSNSSFEQNYSQDNFDSFTSDQVAESIASDNLNTGMSTIEQSDEK